MNDLPSEYLYELVFIRESFLKCHIQLQVIVSLVKSSGYYAFNVKQPHLVK